MRFLRSMAYLAAGFLSAATLVGAASGAANASNAFRIVNAVPDVELCVTPYGGGRDNGTLLVQWRCNGDLSQDWAYVATDWGQMIRNKESGRCITPSGGSAEDGAYLTLWDCDPHEMSQRWGPGGNGHLMNLNSGKYITPHGGGFASGTGLTLWRITGDGEQYWLAS